MGILPFLSDTPQAEKINTILTCALPGVLFYFRVMAPHATDILYTPPPPARPQTARAAEAVVGGRYVQLLQGHLDRLRLAYDHPNRMLHMDTVLTVLLTSFHDPTVRSLRAVEDLSHCEQLVATQPVERICRSTLSDALRQMDSAHLLPVVGHLMQQLPALRHQDDDLHALLKRPLIAADGSTFTVPADVLWAIAVTRKNGAAGRQFRLNLQLDVLRFVPVHLTLSGQGDGSETAAFARDLCSGVVYVADRNFVDFKFIHAVLGAQSDLVVRLKSDTKFTAAQDRPLTDADRAAGVVSDRPGLIKGSAGSPGFGDRVLREVIVADPRTGKSVRLLTSLLDVPARILGLIYRKRWMIELFFKWLKCVARFRTFSSESPNGIAMQLYVAVIAVLLTYLRTGRRPGVYTAHCLHWVASGLMTVETMLKVLEMREREASLARARLAKKRESAAKKSV